MPEMIISIVIALTWYSYLRIDAMTEGLGSNRTSRDHSNNCIIEISQNTDWSPGDVRRLVDTQTPVKDHQLLLI